MVGERAGDGDEARGGRFLREEDGGNILDAADSEDTSDLQPATNIGFYDALKWLNARSEREGLERVSRGIARPDERERPEPVLQEGKDAVLAEVGAHGRPVRAGRRGTRRVVLGRDPDVAALEVEEDDEPRRTRAREDALHRRDARGAVALEARGLDLHRGGGAA